MSLPLAAVATVALLLGNGFFVAAEFALVAAKRHRLERAAARGSRQAAAAVAGIRELSLMLAGAQLGITMCSLGLAMVAEPAFEHVLAPPLEAVGVPETAVHVISFGVALAVITFLHMVIGEMAPKSWAIAHPERSAMLLAPPFRGFTLIVRPLIAALNGISNGVLRLFKVRPADGTATRVDPGRLRFLLDESQRLGLIDANDHDLLARAITNRLATITSVVTPAEHVTVVPYDAAPGQIRQTAARTGHTRLLVGAPDGTITGALHVRDALIDSDASSRADDLAYPVPRLAATTPVLQAVATMQSAHAQLALVTGPDRAVTGIVTLDDLLGQLLRPG